MFCQSKEQRYRTTPPVSYFPSRLGFSFLFAECLPPSDPRSAHRQEGLIQFKVSDGNNEDCCFRLGDISRTPPPTRSSPIPLRCGLQAMRLLDPGGHSSGRGKFITMLPQTRMEDSQFSTWLIFHTSERREVSSHWGRLEDDPQDVFQAVDFRFPIPTGSA